MKILIIALNLLGSIATVHAEAPMTLNCKSTQNTTILKINVYMNVGRIGKSSTGTPTIYTLVAQDGNSGKKQVFHLTQVSNEGMIEELTAMERDDITVRMDSSQLLAKVKFGKMRASCSPFVKGI